MNDYFNVEYADKIDAKLFNVNDTIRYLKDGVSNPIIAIKLILNLSIFVLNIIVFIIIRQIEISKEWIYLLFILDLYFLNNGKVTYLVINRKFKDENRDLSQYEIMKFCDSVKSYDEEHIEFTNVTLPNNEYVFKKLNSNFGRKEPKNEKMMLVIYAANEDDIYVLDLSELNRYSRSYRKKSKKIFNRASVDQNE